MNVADVRRLKRPESENARLKKLLGGLGVGETRRGILQPAPARRVPQHRRLRRHHRSPRRPGAGAASATPIGPTNHSAGSPPPPAPQPATSTACALPDPRQTQTDSDDSPYPPATARSTLSTQHSRRPPRISGRLGAPRVSRRQWCSAVSAGGWGVGLIGLWAVVAAGPVGGIPQRVGGKLLSHPPDGRGAVDQRRPYDTAAAQRRPARPGRQPPVAVPGGY